jgi:hypothetical protein
MIDGRGAEMMKTWKGEHPEYLVSSIGYVIMKKLFSNSETIKVSKVEFYNKLNVNHRSCFRSIDKIKDYGLDFAS